VCRSKHFQHAQPIGSESTVAVISDKGTFEVARVPPGWYRLTVAPQPTASSDRVNEFGTKLIEVQDRDIDGVSLVLGTGVSILGRVVAESGIGIPSAVGLRVSASPVAEEYLASRAMTATVDPDWSFRMTGLSGSYQFTAGADKPPFVKATRITVDGLAHVCGIFGGWSCNSFRINARTAVLPKHRGT
jgi:hypothetical protein